MSLYDVAIIGGGIAGLSTAWYLEQQAEASGAPRRYVLLEQAGRWGGHIRTERVEDERAGKFVIEAGPDSFLTQKPWGLELAHALGLQDRLLGTNDDLRKTFVLHRGKPTPLPDGVLLIVPTKFTPFAFSPLLSPWGKLRMGMDLFIPARRDDGDETLADFVRRRLGSEALDKIAEPLMSGIYNSEAERQSLLATFPRFRQLEEKYGSLTRGMLAARRSNNGHGATNGKKDKPLSMFMSLRDGMGELVDVLGDKLRGEMRLNASVQTIRRSENGAFHIRCGDGVELGARAVVVASPAFAAADTLEQLIPAAADALRAVRYVSTGTISLAYRARDLTRPLRGFGLVVPRSERRPINAITVSSIKFDQRAPQGYELLRVFFGGSRSPQSMELDDEALLRTVRAELRSLMGVESAPLFHRIYRWSRSNAQYDVGHLDRIAALEAGLPQGLFLTGSPYRGVGLPDCIKQGQDTARVVNGYLQ